MKHFEHIPQTDELFFEKPYDFTKDSPKELLSSSLGATLYMPATRKTLYNDLIKMRYKDASSIVVCLEDSIPDDEVEEAEKNLHELLLTLMEKGEDNLPLIFVRPRTPEHFYKITQQNKGLLSSLTGFVFPKFDAYDQGDDFCYVLQKVNEENNLKLYFMPVIESPSVIHRETRKATLSHVSKIIEKYNDELLAIRIGATDMSSSYGIRRSSDFTIYDVHVVSSAIADIVNVLGRAEDHHIITGAVWEHFTQKNERVFKTSLRENIFSNAKELRAKLLTQGYDNFIKEIQLDKINGITGKTIIHPSHISIVNSLLVVSHEEYLDACDIMQNDNGGGAYTSHYRNKMNEVKPHYAWAEKTINRAKMFGVAKEKIDFVDFLERFEK